MRESFPARRGADDITELLQTSRETVALLGGLLGIDLGARDGGVPELLAVAWREVLGVQADLLDGGSVPANFLQPRRQLAPRQPGGNHRTVVARDLAADQDVEQAQ